MNIDLLPPTSSPPPRRPWPVVAVVLLLAVVSIVWLLIPGTEPITPQAPPTPVAELKAPPGPVKKTVRSTIPSGETVTSLLGEMLSPQQIYNLERQARDVFPLTGLKAGQGFRLTSTDEQFTRFEYDIDREQMLIVEPAENGGFKVYREDIPYTVRVDRVYGVIQSSLFETVTEIGEEAELALSLADIFAWDIDFILDIRVGDRFTALVEKRFRDGEWAGYGNLLAAEFVNQGDPFRAFAFQDGNRSPGYYDEEGNSLRKAFLKAPLAFSRISSGFSMKRFHPITKTWKAHPAIDYAAPTGTPIKSVGDGTILRIGYTKGNGNFIEIRHNGSYKTMYLHMSRFARGLKKGSRVNQGQTIGYVGSTGLATGPHLCFRMFRNDAPVNPTRLKSPAVAPVSAENRERYLSVIRPLLARLNGDEPEAQAALSGSETKGLN